MPSVSAVNPFFDMLPWLDTQRTKPDTLTFMFTAASSVHWAQVCYQVYRITCDTEIIINS